MSEESVTNLMDDIYVMRELDVLGSETLIQVLRDFEKRIRDLELELERAEMYAIEQRESR